MIAAVEKMFSACGKFEIRLEERLAAPLLMPHDTAATTCPTAAAATATATVSCSSCSNKHSPRHAHSKRSCGLINLCIALLAIFSFTQNTNALPRQLYGRQYILPHQSRAHRHHVHQRAAGEKQMITQAAIPPQKADPKGSFMPTLAKLKSARDTANISHKYIRDLMEEYVVNITKTAASEKDVAIQYKLHHLNLDYPLHAEANGSFDPSETEPTEAQFLRILDTLSIIHHLVESQGKRLSFRKYNSTFAFAKDKILQNRACVLEILGRDDSTVGMPGYKYNKYHDFLEYGVLQEAEKILILLEHKYSHMLKIWMDSGNP